MAFSATMSEVVCCLSGGEKRPNSAGREAELLHGGQAWPLAPIPPPPHPASDLNMSLHVKDVHFCPNLLFGQRLLLVT